MSMFAVVHETLWPDGTVHRDTASSVRDEPDINHLDYCKGTQERDRPGSDGRYFIAELTELDDDGKPVALEDDPAMVDLVATEIPCVHGCASGYDGGGPCDCRKERETVARAVLAAIAGGK